MFLRCFRSCLSHLIVSVRMMPSEQVLGRLGRHRMNSEELHLRVVGQMSELNCRLLEFGRGSEM